ncbi:hypothetical protein FB45DRAFT_905571 [Roridomyces roridus]|uniref:F-box domain-containing protein n=1 Tax=Roridomyces roridus TaxID=1738132 RepID=A0AAD7C5V7_9AGAR|nr:hypothetical protein FB45DRAFT_905571 [Roridomyces roridus]
MTIPIPTPWTLLRCQQLAKSNEAPSSSEITFIRAVESETTARLTRLEDEILRLRHRLDELQAERDQLSAYHSQNLSILSPLRRLPPEVLAEIFSWSLPAIREMAGTTSDLKKSPWVLAQVNRRWREVSLSTPLLWSTVCVSYMGLDASGFPPPEMIQAQIDRVGQTLKIHFSASESCVPDEQHDMFELLSAHSARWEDLDIQLNAALFPRLAALRGRLPSLRRLWIQWDNADSDDEQTGVGSIKCFETASSLVDVGVKSESRFIPILLPAYQLTSYRLHGPWEMHERVLKLAPNLVEARVIIAFDSSEWPNAINSAIDLPHLRRLYTTHVEVLDHLRTPALSEIAFWLDHDQIHQEDPFDRLDAFFVRSSCTPQQLCLKGFPDASTTAEILKKYPSITSFVLIINSFDDEDVGQDVLVNAVDTHLTMLTLGNDPISPHLRSISFATTQSIPIDYPLFLKMLQSRRRNPYSALCSAAFLTREGPDPDPVTRVRLEALRDAGLGLCVESGQKTNMRMDLWTCECSWNAS